MGKMLNRLRLGVDAVLGLLIALLAVLLVFSVVREKGIREEPFIRTAFLNPSKNAAPKEIILRSNEGEGIHLTYSYDVWIGECNGFVFPVEQKQVEKLVETLKSVRKMYKKIDEVDKKIAHIDSFLPLFFLSYTLSDGTTGALHFYQQDFSKTMRFVSVNDDEAVYATLDDMGAFLHAEARFWYDPFIAPHALRSDSALLTRAVLAEGGQRFFLSDDVHGAIRLQKLSELRHGSLVSVPGQAAQESPRLTLAYEDGFSYSVLIHLLDDGDAVFVYDAGEPWNFAVSVSAWTYRSFRSLFD